MLGTHAQAAEPTWPAPGQDPMRAASAQTDAGSTGPAED